MSILSDVEVGRVNEQLASLWSKLNVQKRRPVLTVFSFSRDLREVHSLLILLLSTLHQFNPEDESLSAATTVDKVFSTLKQLGYDFSEDAGEAALEALVVIVAELQQSIIKGRQPVATLDHSDAMDIDENEGGGVEMDMDTTGRIAIQLDKICRLLKIDASSAHDTDDIVSLIRSTIEKQVIDTHPSPDQILHPQRILKALTLSDAQRAIVQNIEETLFQDFTIRRQMMLTRFQVTLESLLGDEDEGNESSEAASSLGDENGPAMVVTIDEATKAVRAAVKAQLRSINPQPARYQWEDALEAPLAVFYEQAQRVHGEAYSSAGGVVKKVVVGPVPDRGGRVNELRQKKAFQEKRYGGGGGGGGRGGGHKHQFKKGKDGASGDDQQQGEGKGTEDSQVNNNNNKNNHKGNKGKAGKSDRQNAGKKGGASQDSAASSGVDAVGKGDQKQQNQKNVNHGKPPQPPIAQPASGRVVTVTSSIDASSPVPLPRDVNSPNSGDHQQQRKKGRK